MITAVMTLSVLAVEHNANVLKASILPTVTHAPFDGTVAPVQKVPNWAQLTTAEYDEVYSRIPASKIIDLPDYSPVDFRTSFDSLKWGDPATEDLRNAKITYSVPYMGSYSLDSAEYEGSHLGVDLKLPNGTPLFAIGNGIAVKVSKINSGFGYHIVLEHNNFPSYDDPNKVTTYYSSYSHMGSVLISQGDVVRKGDQIGLSGETGTATTPHLHFQMDNDSPDWHPYWPFTWSEANAAGLNFWSAVNAGLGADRARATTVNPMLYAQKYEDASATVASEPEVETVAETETETGEVAETEAVSDSTVSDEPLVESEVEAEPEELKVSFEFDVLNSYEVGSDASFVLKMVDQNGEDYEGQLDDVVVVSLTENLGVVSNRLLERTNFNRSEANIKVGNLTSGRARAKAMYGNETYYSDWFTVEGEEVSEEEDETPAVTSFADVPTNHQNYDAITYLAEEGVISGYPDNTFRPENTVTRAEALRFIFEGLGEQLEVGALPFYDVPQADWSYKYVSTAYLGKVVSGYNDGTFQPGKVVSRSEFLRMLFSAMGERLDGTLKEDPFVDVPKDSWSAKYFKHAKDEGIIDNILRAWPDNGMKRSDVAEAIYRVMND